MDTGVQLGRRFRALKLWMILRYFGAEGLRARLAEHIRLAHLFADWVDADERLRAPRPGPVQRRLLPRRVPHGRRAVEPKPSSNRSTSACSTP